ncbi:MAG: outer membrane beta-barrel protein, partial [Pseudolabrys sp.]
MPRLRPLTPVTPRGARLLMAACLALWSADAVAQTALPPFPDPLAPTLQTDPRHPQRFQRFTRPGLAQLGPPVNFLAAASGAGNTGYDSTNARKRTKLKGTVPAPNLVTPTADANAATPGGPPPPIDPKVAAANAQAIAPGVAAPYVVPRYQTPPPDTDAFAAAPGTPPVELGPIGKLPPTRKAHTEPDDPYAPLGLRAGAFDLFPAVELIGGYDTNPGRVAGGAGAAVYIVAPELRAQSDWSRHELKVDLRGSYTDYSPDETPTLSRPYFNGKVDGRIDATRDTHIDLDTRLLISTDNPG